MKNILILLAVVLVAAGVYWKFRDQIHGKIDEVKKDEQGGATSSVVKAVKDVVPIAPVKPKVEEKLSLVSSEFIRGLPDSMANLPSEGGANRDMVVEFVAGEGTLGFPSRLRLTPNVWLDTSTIQFPGGIKAGTAMLVHLQSVGPAGGNVAASEYVVRCSAEPLPQPMEAGIRRDPWRAAIVATGSPASPALPRNYWITEFLQKNENNELQGVYLVEGTFSSYHRAAANAPHDYVILEEAKNAKFFFNRVSLGSGRAAEAEQIKKQGNRITLKLKVDASSSPKFMIQDIGWGIPVKEQFDYWSRVIADKGLLGNTLALAAWAEVRNVTDGARTMYEKAHGQVTRESALKMGAPIQAIRIHLSDAVDDQWFYGSVASVQDPNHHPVWRQAAAQYSHDFVAFPKRPCVIFQTNASGSLVGDYYLLQE